MKDNEVEWKLCVNRALCKSARGARVVLKGLDRVIIEYALRLAFKATNNMEKYEALVKVLDLAKGMKHRRLNMYSDT